MLSKIHLLVVILAAVAMIVGIVAQVTHHWLSTATSTNRGLWKSCDTVGCTDISSFLSKKEKQRNNVTRVLTIALIVLTFAGALVLAISRESPNMVAAGLGLLLVAALSGVTALIVYGVSFNKDGDKVKYSYWLELVATAFAIAATVVLGITSHLKSGGASAGASMKATPFAAQPLFVA